MNLSLVSPPTTEPVSLGEAKDHCRVDGTDQDALLAGHIVAARQHCEQVTGRSFLLRTYDLTLDGDWPLYGCDPRINLPKPPAVSGTSVTYVDSAGATQTLPGASYVLSKDSIGGAIVPAYGVTWPAVRPQPNAIMVRYVAGYGPQLSDVPEPIRHAILLYTRFLFDGKDEDEAAADRMLFRYRAEFF